MYCSNCGREVDDKAIACPNCGCAVNGRKSSLESKTWLGVVLALFTGIVGLIIGVCIYPANTIERSSFIRGWLITFLTSLIVGIILSLFLVPSLWYLF